MQEFFEQYIQYLEYTLRINMPVYKLREGLLAIKVWGNYWVYGAWASIQSETKRNASYVKYSGMQNVKAWISYMGSQKVRKDSRVKHSFISTSRCEAENFWARCHYRGHIWRVAQGASLIKTYPTHPSAMAFANHRIQPTRRKSKENNNLFLN